MKSIVKRLTLVILLIIVVALLAVFAGVVTNKVRFYAILTGSMRPDIPPGSAIMVSPEPVSQIRIGQVIVARLPKAVNPDFTDYAHRVVWIKRVKNGSSVETLVRTRGDANKLPDRWVVVFHGGSVYHERLSIPLAGYLVAPDYHRYVWLGMLDIVVIAFDIWAVRWIWRHYASGSKAKPTEHDSGVEGNLASQGSDPRRNNTVFENIL